MYELIRAGEQTWYIDCPAKMGLFLAEDGAWLIDSGNDKDAGRRVRKLLDANGWTLAGILNTHSNADHIGGNRFLQDRYHCPVYSTPAENALIRAPRLEPSFLYGGYPCKALCNKFLMAQESAPSPSRAPRCPKGRVFPLPGHFFGMVGFRTPDGVCFSPTASPGRRSSKNTTSVSSTTCAPTSRRSTGWRRSRRSSSSPRTPPWRRISARSPRLTAPRSRRSPDGCSPSAPSPARPTRSSGRCSPSMGSRWISTSMSSWAARCAPISATSCDEGLVAARFEDNRLLWERV
ncbi:MAG: MBL fold metallo-hydrolase [Anaerotruncus massiliensis (ex Togo et al. 2019)]